MNTPKLFQFPNGNTVDLNQVQITSHIYFRYHNLQDKKDFFIKLYFITGGEHEFYLGDIQDEAERFHESLVYRWGQDK